MKNIDNKQDHRVLGEQLGLFKFSEMAPGIPFFLPKGVFLYNQLLALIRIYYSKYNYQEIMSPLFMSSELWKISGHFCKFLVQKELGLLAFELLERESSPF